MFFSVLDEWRSSDNQIRLLPRAKPNSTPSYPYRRMSISYLDWYFAWENTAQNVIVLRSFFFFYILVVDDPNRTSIFVVIGVLLLVGTTLQVWIKRQCHHSIRTRHPFVITPGLLRRTTWPLWKRGHSRARRLWRSCEWNQATSPVHCWGTGALACGRGASKHIFRQNCLDRPGSLTQYSWNIC